MMTNRLSRKFVITTIITFTLFGLEAMFHYNLGHNKGRKMCDFTFVVPPLVDVVKILGVVFVISMVNGYAVERFAG